MNHKIVTNCFIKNLFCNIKYFSISPTFFKLDESNNNKDISRMPKRYHDRMLHVNEPDPSIINPNYYNSLFQSIRLKRKLFAKYGTKSDLNPGILWPSESELEEIIEFESEWEPTLQQRWHKLKTEREEEINSIRSIEKLVSNNMSKMNDHISDYSQRLKKQREQEAAQEAKREALIDEAREYFGYRLEPSDPRFENMKLAKEEEEKKLRKKKRKKSYSLNMFKVAV